MSLNFFQDACQESALSIPEFGLCDDQNGGKAYTDSKNKYKWIAIVKNENEIPVVFTAIDKCVLSDSEFKGRGRCDGMLTTDIHLYLVELKNQNPPWRTHAIEQLESTIQFLRENHNISRFKKCKAFASNKKHAAFVELDNEFNKSFFQRTGFRIDVQAEIVII